MSVTTARGTLKSPHAFYIYQLCKYILYLFDLIKSGHLLLREYWTYEEQLIEILDHKEESLPMKVHFLKVF